MNRGFTLLELLVAVSIFAIVVAVSSSLFISVLKAQRRAFATRRVMDNARFALETMSKTIRMSTVLTSSSGSVLEICHPTKGISGEPRCVGDGLNIVRYELVSGDVGCIHENGIPLTSSEVDVVNLRFAINGVGEGDGIQPKITIILNVEDLKAEAEINLQTTISPRRLGI